MKKVKIFYSESSEEIKNSLVRYFKFAKDIELSIDSLINLSKFDKGRYFDEIYPAAFDNCDLYFIFDENLDMFQDNNKITISGLIFSIIVDLSTSQRDDIKLNFFKSEFEDFIIHNEIELEDFNTSDDKHIKGLVGIEKIKVKELKGFYSIIGHAHSLSNEELKKIEEILNSVTKNQIIAPPKNEEKKTPTNINLYDNILKNLKVDALFILIIDDVLGNYNNTFLPFYVWLKSKINEKVIIMRGLYDPLPENLVNAFRNFPADIILVDIDFQEMGARWKEDPAYKFYYSQGERVAGAILYKSLNAFKETGVFVKKPEIKIFSGLTQLEKKISEKNGFLKTKEGIESLVKFLNNTYVSLHEDEEIYKKIVFLRKYYQPSENMLNTNLSPQEKEFFKKIWDTIILKPIPSMAKEEEEEKSKKEEEEKDKSKKKDNEEWMLVSQNYKYFDNIKGHLDNFYTGLEDIEFNGELKPIIGDRIKELEK
jgi:hypothetical protein